DVARARPALVVDEAVERLDPLARLGRVDVGDLREEPIDQGAGALVVGGHTHSFVVEAARLSAPARLRPPTGPQNWGEPAVPPYCSPSGGGKSHRGGVTVVAKHSFARVAGLAR